MENGHSSISSFRKVQKAYTLVELLIIIMIMGVLFTIGYAGYRDYARRQVMAGVVKQIQGDLRLAQQMALSGQKPEEKNCLTNDLEGVYFGIACSPDCVYKIGAVCGDDPTQSNYPTIKEVSLPEGILFNFTDVARNPIVFKVLGQGTNIPKSENAVITLTQAGTDNTGNIVINSGGEIE